VDLPRVALLGTGRMGAPIGACWLRAGYPLAAWNRTPDKVDGLVELGAERARTPSEAAKGADFVVLMVTDAAAVETVLFDLGVAEVLSPPAIVIVASTIAATSARGHAARLAEMGLGHLDAPVSGGTRGATEGTLSVFVGGTRDDFLRAEPTLAAIGRPYHLGPPGAGQVAKCANQLIVALSIAAISEAFVLGEVGGLDLEVLHEALLGGFADSTVLREHGGRMLRRDFVPGATLRNQLKDMRAIASEVEEHHLDLPVTKVVGEVFAEAAARFPSLDPSALFLELERRNGLPAPQVPRPRPVVEPDNEPRLTDES
jgi:2-hydroxy-3-oxopropionate reductase